MPVYDDRRYRNASRERFHVPPLELEVTHHPPYQTDAMHYPRYNDNRHHPRYNDVRHRRARSDRDPKRRPQRDREALTRAHSLITRASTYGYDRHYMHDYHSPGEFETARVRLYTHDSHDPYSCTCYPRVSSRTIPSMMYDQVRCPHPDHNCPQAKLDYFAYPWTAQSYRPHVVLEHGYLRGQIKPPSAVTAPPFHVYNTKEYNPSKGSKPPPYSAPEKPIMAPLLPIKPSDRRLRRADRQRVLPALDEEEEVSPFDSASQVVPVRSFRPPSLRLRTVDARVLGRVESEMRLNSAYHALSTPPARPALDFDGFPETPNRIFKGEYVDTGGKKYQYDIKYGKSVLDGKRTRLQTT